MADRFSEGQLVAERYQLVKLLGEGGMGSVWIALHTATSRRVALKVILPEKLTRDEGREMLLGRFEREAKALGQIESPYVTQVLDAGTDRSTGAAFLVMELFDGEDVSKLIERLGPLPPPLALRITLQAALGLQTAHEAGIVHRDIKPANLFLSRRRDGEHVAKVLDFGIVKLRGEHEKGITKTGMVFGSVSFMSPEQLQASKDLDHRSDLWSLGVALYEMLTGGLPFVGLDLGQVVTSICLKEPPPLLSRAPWVPRELAAIVDKCLRKHASERYESAAALAADLRRCASGDLSITAALLVALPDEVRSQVVSSEPPRAQVSSPDVKAASVTPVPASVPVAAGTSPFEQGYPRSSGDAQSGGTTPILAAPASSATPAGSGAVAAARSMHQTGSALPIPQTAPHAATSGMRAPLIVGGLVLAAIAAGVGIAVMMSRGPEPLASGESTTAGDSATPPPSASTIAALATVSASASSTAAVPSASTSMLPAGPTSKPRSKGASDPFSGQRTPQ